VLLWASLIVSALDLELGVRMLRRYPGISAMGTVAMAVAIALGMLYFEGLDKVLQPRVATYGAPPKPGGAGYQIASRPLPLIRRAGR
jgi:hypothetical protein